MKAFETSLFTDGPIFGIEGADELEAVIRAEDPVGFAVAEVSFPYAHEIAATEWLINTSAEKSGKKAK